MTLLDPDQRTNAGQELGRVQRLCHEVVRPGLEGANAFLVLGRGHHDDRQEGPLRVGPDPSTDLVPVDVRHPDVQEDQVRPAIGDPLEGLCPGPGCDDLVALGRQQGLEQPDVPSDVVHDEDPSATRHPCPPRPAARTSAPDRRNPSR